MSPAPPSSALIVRLSSIGDVIHTLPAFCALRDAWPEARLGWAVEPAAAPLVRALPGPLQVHVLDTASWRRRWWDPASWRAAADARGALREARYELALDFQGLIKSALVARASRAEVIGLARDDAREPLATRFYDVTAPPSDPAAHIVERSLGVARAAGAEAAEVRFPPLCGDAERRYVDEQLAGMRLDGFIVAHGAANWPSKQWPRAELAAAGRGLFRRTGLPVVWAWGPGEHDAARHIALAAGEGNVAGFATTLPQLAALLARARLFVGGDSAPLHLAVACGTPTVAIFGPTSPRRLGPLDPHDISVISRQPCSFCHQRRCALGTRACLETLPAGDVVAAAEQRLATVQARAV